MKKLCLGIFAMVLILVITGCSKLEPMTFEEIYSGDLSEVSKIEIRHGNGELKEITDQSIINSWLDSLKNIVFEPSTNQDGQVGYLYNVSLFEEEILTLSFSTTQINDVYYNENEQVLQQLHSLFNEN
ncbi:hypothetical protein MKY09_06145 [Psychrobacillus sp. FSL K6-4046]|uniref:hypothetical protein n=1 Tax=Psychrobacillus sp. FSL K6-4046 TaxID=2921550 RepID=UPI00315B2084